MDDQKCLYNLETLFIENRMHSAAVRLQAFLEHKQDCRLSEERFLSLNNVIFGELSETGNLAICGNDCASYADFLYTLSFRPAFRGDCSELIKTGELLIDLCGADASDEDCLRSLLKKALSDWRETRNIESIRSQYAESSKVLELALANPDKPKYLFNSGYLIDQQIMRLNRQLNLIDEAPLLRLASDVAESFLRSFRLAGGRTEPSEGSIVRLVYRQGYERVLSMVRVRLELAGLRVLVVPPFYSPPESGAVFRYFQNFYVELLDEELCELDFECFEKAVLQYQGELEQNCGFIDIMSFTQACSSRTVQHSPAPSDESLQRFIALDRRKVALLKEYLSPDKTSFCFFPLPRPSEGDDFNRLLPAVLDVNSGEGWIGEAAQQRLIDDIDRGDTVLIEGRDGNETSLIISLAALDGGGSQTNFTNTGMSQNIPAGEIFTTPVLEGTSGLLHLKSFYFQGHHFTNLRFSFSDGMVTGCSCEEGIGPVRNILMGGHESLPIGELGIGTNAGAYKLIRDFKLYESAPILISEKTAPHLAIGDSCYARQSPPVYNEYSGKEVAVANNNPELYNIHIDMALPFAEIGRLSVRLVGGGELVIIRDGAYLPAYLKDLNKYISG